MKVVFTLIGFAVGFALSLLIASLTPAGLNNFLNIMYKVLTAPPLFSKMIAFSLPIAASAISLVLAYKANFITIGTEGQVLLGSTVALWVLAYSPFPNLFVAFLLASALGALLSLIVALLKLIGVNEILSSLMLNYIVMYVMNHLIACCWSVQGFTMTKEVPSEFWLDPYTAFYFIIASALIVFFIEKKTILGYEIRALGKAEKAAKTYGVNPKKVLIAVAIIQGTIASIGGVLMLLTFQHYLTAVSNTPGYGYMGVLVVWLSLLNAFLCIPASIFFSLLVTTTWVLQMFGTSLGVSLALQAVILLAVSAFQALGKRWEGVAH